MCIREKIKEETLFVLSVENNPTQENPYLYHKNYFSINNIQTFYTRDYQSASHIYVTFDPTFKISHLFLMVTVKKYHYICWWTSLNLHWSEDLKSKFLACHILNFYMNLIIPLGWFPNIIIHTQQVMKMFDTAYSYEQLFSKMKHTKCMLHSQLSNHHLSDVLLLSNSSFNPDITYFCDNKYQMSLMNYECYCVNLAVLNCSPGCFCIKLCGPWSEKVGETCFKSYFLFLFHLYYYSSINSLGIKILNSLMDCINYQISIIFSV